MFSPPARRRRCNRPNGRIRLTADHRQLFDRHNKVIVLLGNVAFLGLPVTSLSRTGAARC